MAMSNWDLLALNSEGKPVSELVGFQGQRVALYKNWLYLYHGESEEKDGDGEKPSRLVIKIDYGELATGDFDIVARRGPQEGIFAIAQTTKWNEENKEFDRKWIAGIGCAGYSETTDLIYEAMGVNPDDYDYCGTSTLLCSEGNFYEVRASNNPDSDNPEYHDWQLPMEGNEHLEAKWVGVTKETLESFQEWLQYLKEEDVYMVDYIIDDIIEKFQNNPKRINQGDLFFSKALDGGKELSAGTKVGEAEIPIISRMIGSVTCEPEENTTPTPES